MVGMNVPLKVDSYVDHDGNQKLEIWTNGKRKIIDPPFKPYFISKAAAPWINGHIDVEQIKGSPLSTLREAIMYKYSFPNTGAIATINRIVDREGTNDQKRMLCDNHTEFRERIIIDLPGYFSNFSNTDDLKVFCFDLETLMLNRRDFDSIVSAAWGWGMQKDQIKSSQATIYWRQNAHPDSGPMLYMDGTEIRTVEDFITRLRQDPPQFNCANEELIYDADPEIWERGKSLEFFRPGYPFVLPEDEKRVINALLSAMRVTDPDIITGYYLEDFDFTRLFERCNELSIPYNDIARNMSVKIATKRHGYEEKKKITIGGRVIYDVYESVKRDQSLHGIKRRGLKDVAEWFKLPVLREDTQNIAIIPRVRLREYNEHDVFSTLQLFNMYFRNTVTLCEMFSIPINMMLDASASFLANVFHAIDLHRIGIVSDGMNRERAKPGIYDRRELNESAGIENDDDSDAAYEAAYVDIYQTGYFEHIDKADYTGMYNAIEITGNFSPETTKIIGFDIYNEDGYRCEKRGDLTVYYIPDKRIGKNVIIVVNNSFDGVLRKKLREIRETRFAIKQQMKTCAPEEIPRLESQQYGLKVVANIPSGYNGQAVARWGDIAVSIATVGIGRLLIRDTVRYLESKYGDGDWIWAVKNLKTADRSKFKVCIEVDTDGIYVCKKVDINDLNDYLTGRVKELLQVNESEMKLEFDEYGAGCFIKMKNYLLYDKKGNLIIHGAGLKGSRQPKCFDISLERLAKCLLLKEGRAEEIIADLLNIEKFKTTDLILGLKLGKNPNAESAAEGGYDKGSMFMQLINKAKAEGIDVKTGFELDYIKTWDGYDLAHNIKSMGEVDVPYYRNMIVKLIENLGLHKELMASTIESNDDWIYSNSNSVIDSKGAIDIMKPPRNEYEAKRITEFKEIISSINISFGTKKDETTKPKQMTADMNEWW